MTFRRLNHVADSSAIAAARSNGTKVTFDCGLTAKPRAMHARRPVCLECVQRLLAVNNSLRHRPSYTWTWTASTSSSNVIVGRNAA